ncbi:hypothetical protein [Caryophanon latum]|uniref:Uncharacterized protein n=1 Tax=Caryophanon latum TaxID=33977 RepID=A0A1C0YR29_9BACL|nr:hypothetical protein [Caryophanon latum]OCS89635.1 hypothetical protein A6K76_12360 [Caryophanon latum]
MDDDVLKFLIEQVQWAKEQEVILAKIEGKLRVMRTLAQYRLQYVLTAQEIVNLQQQIDVLQLEIDELEHQLNSNIVH